MSISVQPSRSASLSRELPRFFPASISGVHSFDTVQRVSHDGRRVTVSGVASGRGNGEAPFMTLNPEKKPSFLELSLGFRTFSVGLKPGMPPINTFEALKKE